MKHFLILSILPLCFILLSCNKEKSSKEWIIGTWEHTKDENSLTVGGKTLTDTYKYSGYFYVFEKDGTGREFTESFTHYYTYVFNELTSSLYLRYENGSERNLKIEIVDDDNFIDYTYASGEMGVFATTKRYYRRVR